MRQEPLRSNTHRYIVAGIIVAIAVGIAYGAVSGTFSSARPPTASSIPQNEEVVMHIHVKLSIIIEGKTIVIPENIGINPELYKNHDLDSYGTKNPRMSPLRTYDTSGVIHIESTEIRGYTLGEFFDVWGVTFNEHCVMDKCNDGTKLVRMYVDAKERNDFRQDVLLDGEEIEIVFM